MQLDQLARDSKAEPGTVMLTRWRRVDLREFAEHQLMMITSDSAAVVTDFNHQFLSFLAAPRESNPDLPPLGCELDGVANEIAKHVFDLVAISVDRRQLVSIEPLDGQALLRCQCLVQHPHLVDDFCDVEFSANEIYLIAGA